MTFASVEWSDRRLVNRSPVEPILDEESGPLYLFIDREFSIDVDAPTRDVLADELAEQILFRWEAHAREDEARLTLGARRLREALLSRMKEAPVAPARTRKVRRRFLPRPHRHRDEVQPRPAPAVASTQARASAAIGNGNGA